MNITSEVNVYGNLRIYVSADTGTHHSTIASAVLKYVRGLDSHPDYKEFNGTTRPGKWCVPEYRGQWASVGKVVPHTVKKVFESWPIPA